MRNYFKFLRCGLALGVVGGGLLMNQIAQAQTFLWRTNVGATLLALDGQTNVYVKTANKVITLNSDGIPQVTNTFALSNPLQRDDFGNYYFADVKPAGSTNALYVAKYTGAGSLVWSNSFGTTTSRTIQVNDVEVDKSGNVYVGYVYVTGIVHDLSKVAKIDNTGSLLWDLAMPKSNDGGAYGVTYVTAFSPTNGWVLSYNSIGVAGPSPTYFAVLASFDASGVATVITNWTMDVDATPPLVLDSAGNFFTHEAHNLTKRDRSGAIVWQAPSAGFAVGSDPFGGGYASGGASPEITRFDSTGNVTWDSGFVNSFCELALSDSSGNRFFKYIDGTIARLAAPSTTVDTQAGDGIGSTGFLFSVKSDPNLICEVLSSSNGTSWTSLGFVTNNASGQLQFLDPSATNSLQKYYRIQPR